VGELNSKFQSKREAIRHVTHSMCLLPRILPAEQVSPSDIRSGDLHSASLRHKCTAISGHLHYHLKTTIVPQGGIRLRGRSRSTVFQEGAKGQELCSHARTQVPSGRGPVISRKQAICFYDTGVPYSY
jgi:hypothetical protein